MRTKLRLGAASVIAALAVLVWGTAPATAGTHGTKKLRLVGEQIQSQFLDFGATGPSLGDELVFSESLSRHGREVGVSGVACTITQTTPPYDVTWFHCVGTLSLRRGQITLQGLIQVQGENDPGPFIVAVTGGTGAYRSAGGVAVVRDVSETTSIYKLRLDLPKRRHGR